MHGGDTSCSHVIGHQNSSDYPWTLSFSHTSPSNCSVDSWHSNVSAIASEMVGSWWDALFKSDMCVALFESK